MRTAVCVGCTAAVTATASGRCEGALGSDATSASASLCSAARVSWSSSASKSASSDDDSGLMAGEEKRRRRIVGREAGGHRGGGWDAENVRAAGRHSDSEHTGEREMTSRASRIEMGNKDIEIRSNMSWDVCIQEYACLCRVHECAQRHDPHRSRAPRPPARPRSSPRQCRPSDRRRAQRWPRAPRPAMRAWRATGRAPTASGCECAGENVGVRERDGRWRARVRTK